MKVCSQHSVSLLAESDSRVAEDELQNVDLAEREREKKNQELKIKRRDYTGYDDDEFAPRADPMKRTVLAKYAEFLEGPKETVSLPMTIHALTDLSSRDSALAVPLLWLVSREMVARLPQSPLTSRY